jgi:hypothetical protein
MRRLLVRSTLSALVTACFALSVVTWGWMPGCVLPAATQAADASHAHEAHGGHSHSGSSPLSSKCAVHLCCLQLGAPGHSHWTSPRLAAGEQGSGPVAENAFVSLRPSHSLPFAHAPPLAPIS